MAISSRTKTVFVSFPRLQLRMLLEYGHTDRFIAKFIGISVDSYRRYISEDAELRDCVSNWRQAANANVEEALYQRAIGFQVTEVTFERTGAKTTIQDTTTDEIVQEDEYRKRVVIRTLAPDVDACRFWLKNRDPATWRERVEIDANVSQLAALVKAAHQRLVNKRGDKALVPAGFAQIGDNTDNGNDNGDEDNN